MKPKGRHPDRVLTALKVKSLKKPGRYADGNGLYLVVEPTGAKRWMLRTVVKGRRSDIGLGGIQLVSLADARVDASVLRKIARFGGDPIAAKRTRTAVPTFAQAAQSVHEDHAAAWKNKKHTDQWLNTLSTYAFPYIGTRRVDQIETPEVLKVLSPIWLTKAETARRVKQRIGTVFDWAKAAGYRTGENPVDGVAKGLPKQPDRKKHHAALPYSEMPFFIGSLRGNGDAESSKLAFEFLILTATRTDEVIGLSWSEIEDDVWTLPAERTKPKREHRIPLGPRCLEILRQARQLSDVSDYVFPGRSQGKPLSNMTFLMALRRMSPDSKVTGHGFRSTFRDWASESTGFSNEVAEMALNHVIKNKSEAAYRRGDLFDKRRELMLEWEQFITSKPLRAKPKNDRARRAA